MTEQLIYFAFVSLHTHLWQLNACMLCPYILMQASFAIYQCTLHNLHLLIKSYFRTLCSSLLDQRFFHVACTPSFAISRNYRSLSMLSLPLSRSLLLPPLSLPLSFHPPRSFSFFLFLSLFFFSISCPIVSVNPRLGVALKIACKVMVSKRKTISSLIRQKGSEKVTDDRETII